LRLAHHPGEGTSFVNGFLGENLDTCSFYTWPFNWNKAHEDNGEHYAVRIDQFMVQWVETHAAAIFLTQDESEPYCGEQ
jgi:hypothetical protein